MKGIRVYQGANINAWGLVVCNFFGRPVTQEQVQHFENELVKKA